ncbi:hypothetical protein NQ317_014685 [Molorchus minor]|uniref:Uncharacterized protein n=1 Tax=Molorchus minor TaxID=1323400 RepID=A0ABQ9JJW7_9CUCU|nr:hypothetical protein NQ317_014685 [Molorchus minor]
MFRLNTDEPERHSEVEHHHVASTSFEGSHGKLLEVNIQISRKDIDLICRDDSKELLMKLKLNVIVIYNNSTRTILVVGKTTEEVCPVGRIPSQRRRKVLRRKPPRSLRRPANRSPRLPSRRHHLRAGVLTPRPAAAEPNPRRLLAPKKVVATAESVVTIRAAPSPPLVRMTAAVRSATATDTTLTATPTVRAVTKDTPATVAGAPDEPPVESAFKELPQLLS